MRHWAMYWTFANGLALGVFGMFMLWFDAWPYLNYGLAMKIGFTWLFADIIGMTGLILIEEKLQAKKPKNGMGEMRT